MKISEKLAEIKRREGELARLLELRDSVAKETFHESEIITKEMSKLEIQEARKQLLSDKKKKVDETTLKIDALTKEIIDSKNKINKKNVDAGIDRKIMEIKYIRIELSRIMALLKTYSFRSDLNAGIYEGLELEKRIKELEDRKSKIDAEIQFANWNKEV